MSEIITLLVLESQSFEVVSILAFTYLHWVVQGVLHWIGGGKEKIMNTVRLAAALAIGILGASAGFIACGGDDSNGGPGPSPDGSTDSSKTDTGTGGENDSGNNTDSGRDAGPLEASVSDPNSLRCNNAPCSTADKHCCVQTNGASSCNPNTGAACSGAAEVHCDEKADCTTGVCCLEYKGGTKATTTCAGECKREGTLPQSGQVPRPFTRQVCKTDTECPNSDCKTQNCNGVVLSLCGGC